MKILRINRKLHVGRKSEAYCALRLLSLCSSNSLCVKLSMAYLQAATISSAGVQPSALLVGFESKPNGVTVIL